MDKREEFARALAEWCNGGSWEDDYTKKQKEVWRERADAIRKHPNKALRELQRLGQEYDNHK